MSTRHIPWSGGVFVDKTAKAELKEGPGTTGVLPRFRVHTRVIQELHRRLPNATDGDLIGSLSGRHIDGVAPDLPSTLFIDSLVPVAVPSIGQGQGRVFVPVVKCQDTDVPEAMRSGLLKWRRLNARGAAKGPGTILFRILNAVALCSLSGAGAFSDVSLVLTTELPRFNIWQVPIENSDGTGPLIADVSLAIALAGGTPVHEGEDIGFLARPDDARGSSRIVEPLHLSQADGRDVVGMWSLGGEERGRLASVIFVARSQSKRNRRLQRGTERRQSDLSAGEAEVAFVLAQYSRDRGGPPALSQCQARVDAQEETYVASISGASGDVFEDTLVADFRAATSIAEEKGDVLESARVATGGNLQRLAGQVDELRAVLDANAAGDMGGGGSETPVARRGGEDADGDSSLQDIPRRNIGAEALVSGDLDDLPKALEVDFESISLRADGDDGNTLGGVSVEEDENWERIQSLAEKYLGPNYAAQLEEPI